MENAIYEPPRLEIWLTLGLGMTVLSPYYRSFVHGLRLIGDESVLDFGSGSGVCSRHLAARLQRGGGRLACVDVSHGWMGVIRRTLRRYKNVTFHLGGVSAPGLAKDGFDLVLMHFVLHEIPAHERPLVIQRLAQLLRPSGRMVLREPQGQGLELDELSALAQTAGLQGNIQARKIAIGHVLDADLRNRSIKET